MDFVGADSEAKAAARWERATAGGYASGTELGLLFYRYSAWRNLAYSLSPYFARFNRQGLRSYYFPAKGIAWRSSTHLRSIFMPHWSCLSTKSAGHFFSASR